MSKGAVVIAILLGTLTAAAALSLFRGATAATNAGAVAQGAVQVTDSMGMVVSQRSAADGPPTLSAAEIYATQCAIDTPSGGRILLWEMFGSPTPTPTPADMTPQPTPQPGSAERGQRLFTGDGQCASCHSIADDQWLVGPPLRQVASRAGTKREGMSAQDYLRAVIMNPDMIAPPVMPGVMPRTYAAQFAPGEIEDLVAFLMTLQ